VEEGSYSLKVQCSSSRRVEKIHFEQLQSFWEQLEADEGFRDIVGVDKYSLFLRKDAGMEVAFLNYIPGCTLLRSLFEVEKVVALALALDEAVEVCERRGAELEGDKLFELQPYMA
jgi:hypothetical protein